MEIFAKIGSNPKNLLPIRLIVGCYSKTLKKTKNQIL